MKAKNIIAGVAAAVMLFGGSMMLTGCGTVSNLMSDNPIGQAISSSKKTGADDWKNYALVQDATGKEYPTVAYFTKKGSTSIDVQALKDILSSKNINWYQMVASSSMGTNTQEYAYVFFPASITCNELNDAVNAINAEGYEGHIVTVEEINKKSSDAGNGATIDLYHSENTYYGPAAQKK